MYNKADIIFKIGTILSFFLLGIDNVSFFNSIIPIGTYNIHLSYIKDFFLFAIFIGIIWSLIYCFKAFKSAHIDLFFQNNKGMFKWIFCNNSNHQIKIEQIVLSSKKDGGEILDCYWSIPSNEVLSLYIQMKKKIIPDRIIIIYQFNDNDPNHLLCKELTKKEIKMFKKLSQK
jgi:hypothetical protein